MHAGARVHRHSAVLGTRKNVLETLVMAKSPNSRVAEPSTPDAAWRRAFRRQLLAWYRRHKRDLPWRRTSDPYAVWVSEIMLQQTQVATVIPYFERFLAAFPTIRALAAADERDVLRHWEGLGYYRRARQMHLAARVLVAQHAASFPRELDTVRTLPGIGRYTAGAIASIAFDLRAPILEANTVRLLSRLVAFDGDPASTAGQHALWSLADALLPARGCGEFNQALMELGSLVCAPPGPPAIAVLSTNRARPSLPVANTRSPGRANRPGSKPCAKPLWSYAAAKRCYCDSVSRRSAGPDCGISYDFPSRAASRRRATLPPRSSNSGTCTPRGPRTLPRSSTE